MTLTLAIRNVASLENGMPTEFVLHRRGGLIGRAPSCDWSLPDPHRYISSRHCEVTFHDEAYWLTDVSTNGTFLNGEGDRLQGERRLQPGDVILVGHYEIVADLSGAAAVAIETEGAADQSQSFEGWDKWDRNPQAEAPAPPASSGWGSSPSVAAPAAPAAAAAPSGAWAPASVTTSSDSRFEWGKSQDGESGPPAPAGGWGPSHNASDIPHGGSAWQAPQAAPDPASEWSSAAPDRPPPPSADDVWGKIAEGNVVDWARGGFGAPPPQQQQDPLGLTKSQSAADAFGAAPRAPAAPTARSAAPAAAPAPAPTARSIPARAAPAGAGGDQVLAELLAAAGVAPGSVKGTPAEIARRSGSLLQRLIAGLVVLVEARARAKSQMGAESTRLEFDGNNPIKFARTPEQAIAQLLNPKEKGFLDSDRAVEDAFFDLQSHQVATLKAMQGALRATLDRFAPESIRKRADTKGVLAKVLPGARDAALWQNYEREFSGVARGSDEAFMDVFAKEFRKAYDEQSRSRR